MYFQELYLSNVVKLRAFSFFLFLFFFFNYKNQNSVAKTADIIR